MNGWKSIHTTLAFFSLAMAIITLWPKRSPWIWAPFLLIAFILGYFSGLIAPVGFLFIGGLFVLHTLIQGEIKGLARTVLVLAAIALSLGLALSLLPGFKQFPVKVEYINLSSSPYFASLGFNKPMIGFFVLALGFPLASNSKSFKKILKRGGLLSLIAVSVMGFFALSTHLVSWSPKLPKFFWFFAIQNLVFVCIVQEAFWRGFVQNELRRFLGRKSLLAIIISIVITSLLFTFVHFWWIESLSFLSLTFLAGIFYGSIYYLTDAIEGSILAHFLFNMALVLLFDHALPKGFIG